MDRENQQEVTPSPRWRGVCRVLHRDLGYLFFGLTVVYAVSGIALNHRNDWNPSYHITRQETPLPASGTNAPLTAAAAVQVLREAGITGAYQSHYVPAADQVRIFFQGGNATLDLAAKTVVIESLRRRPVLHAFNTLHYNPGRGWTWVADIYSAALLIVAVTGLFLLRGHQGITRRGGVLIALGLLLPGVLAWVYLW